MEVEPDSSPSAFQHLKQAPEDPIIGVTTAYHTDASPVKLNVGEGKPYVPRVVQEAELRLSNDLSRNKDYLPITGNPQFTQLSAKLIFGADSPALNQKRVCTVQCLSGTGSIRVGAEFLAKHYAHKIVYIPIPTWGNHPTIFTVAGLQILQLICPGSDVVGFNGPLFLARESGYEIGAALSFNLEKFPIVNALVFEQLEEESIEVRLLRDLTAAPSGVVVVLHACAHNPTGVDPTADQWKGIQKLIRGKNMLPFFDCAYQGFASGNLDKDAFTVRLFAGDGGECFVAQSYAKNMGLYGERVGALSMVCGSELVAKRVESQVKLIIRPMYSTPPIHGAAVAATVLGDRELFNEWKADLQGMADRIMHMRHLLHEALKDRGTPGDWTHIIKQIGMFSFTGLTKEQVAFITNKFHIYITFDGRVSMAGLSVQTVPYLAEAIHTAVTTVLE
ncbi:hypothetical protein L7F22_009929 [Adiantum nelumboides]|nr:hypothetical protein [Adiantum nelumboides]